MAAPKEVEISLFGSEAVDQLSSAIGSALDKFHGGASPSAVAAARSPSARTGGSLLGSGAALAAGGAAALTGFAAAASPAALNTLAGSARILAGEIGVKLTGAIAAVSAGLQLAAKAVRQMDSETAGFIGKTTALAAGVGFGVLAINKLAGAVGLLANVLKLAGGALTSLPFLGLAAGAALVASQFEKTRAVMEDFIPPELLQIMDAVAEGFKELGAVIGPVVAEAFQALPGIFEQIKPDLIEMAKIAGGTLLFALKGAGEAVKLIAGGMRELNTALGGNLPSILAWGIGIAAAAKAIGLLGGLLGGATLGIRALLAAISAHPFIALAVAVGSVAAAFGLLSSSGFGAARAVDAVAEAAGRVTANLRETQSLIDRLEGGGKLGRQDVRRLGVADQERLAQAGNDRDKQLKAFEQIKADATLKIAGQNENDLRKRALDLQKRFEGIDVQGVREGIANANPKFGPDAVAAQTRIEVAKQLRAGGANEKDLRQALQGGLDLSQVGANVADAFLKPFTEAIARKLFAERAIEQGGIDLTTGKRQQLPGVDAAKGAKIAADETLAIARTQHIQGGLVGIEQARRTLQNAVTNIDPIQQQQMEIERRSEQELIKHTGLLTQFLEWAKNIGLVGR